MIATFISVPQASAAAVVVSFDTQGGSAVSSQNWSLGETLTLPANPTRPGYLFDGWYDAATGGNQPVKNALSFDGGVGSNDVITIPHSNDFNFSNALTIEAWVKTTSTAEGYITTKNEDSFYLTVRNGQLCLYLNVVTTDWFCAGSQLNNGNWRHVAATYDGSSIKLHVDGSLVGTQAASGNIGMGSFPVLIGLRPNGYPSFGGTIYDVRYWNIARSTAQINNSKNLELVGNEHGLVAAYLLNQGVPGGDNSHITTAMSSNSGSPSGTLSGFALSGTSSNWVPRTSSYSPANTSGFTLFARWTEIISTAAIAGVTPPAGDETPTSVTSAGNGYTGTITWASSAGSLNGNFVLGTIYTATITLAAAPGYTFAGVTANFFTVAGATTVTHSANSGIITAVFPAAGSPPPRAAIGTTTFEPGVATNVGITVSNFDQTKRYQATVKFVNATTNIDVENGTLTATQGGTTPVFGFTYSGTKLGFTGTYAEVVAALSSITWNPDVASGGISMRIGISTAPGTNEFYDANSGHYYKYVTTGLSATAARIAAEESFMFGMRGYLVEITSEAENSFIAKETDSPDIWIGASDRVTEGDFIWDGASNTYPRPAGSGTAASGDNTYSGWAGGEPNNHPWDFENSAPELENCVLTNWYGVGGEWNDYPCRTVLPYLIEYGGRPNETSTAISATLTATVSAVNPPVFTALYNLNGALGSLERESDTHMQGRAPITLPGAGTMTKAGYTFAGWSESGTAPVISGTYSPTASVTLKAVWTPINYTITYNPDGGNTTPTQSARTIGQSFNLAAAITKNDFGLISYRFAGWNSGTSIFRANETITVGSENLTFTAEWAQLFEVTYAANGGTFSDPSATKDQECVASPNICTDNQVITLNSAPTRLGFIFAGWEDQGANLVSGSDTGSGAVQATINSSRYLFTARWTAVDYTVTYNADEGNTTPTQSSKNIGQTFTIAAAPTRTGFEFAGWSDGSSTFWPGSVYLVGASNITLTALWSPRYTVTYSRGLGSGTPPTNSSTYRAGDRFEVLSGIGIGRSEFSFNGWSDGTTTYQPGALYTVGTRNLILTAQWVPIFTVSYGQDLGPRGGVPPTESRSFRAGTTFSVLSGSTLTNPGFTFTGWRDGANTFEPGAIYTVGNRDIEFMAQWRANTTARVGGPLRSVFRTITAPKISRSATQYICTPGSYVFVRDGVREEEPKLTSQRYLLLQDGKIVSSVDSALAEARFGIESSYMNSSMSCSIELGQESLLSTVSSLSSIVFAEANQARRISLDSILARYLMERTAAYANREREFTRLEALKKTQLATATTPAEVSLVTANHRKGLVAKTNLWKVELDKAISNRDAGRLAAQATYLETLESSGVSILQKATKVSVTPAPTPTPPTNPQPTAQQTKVGTVYMATGSFFLNDATRASLRALARKINSSGAKSILVYGHTDNRGGVNNTALSQNRARAVAKFLRPLLTSKRISIGWFASKKPVATGASATALALNRRVEIYTK